MKSPANDRHGLTAAWQRRFPSGVVAFFIFFLLYVWLRIEPVVQYFSSRPVFYVSHSFFSGFLKRPGGLAEYAAAFLAQMNYYNWLGAIVFTGLACLVFLTVGWWLRRVSSIAPGLAPYGPALLLLFMCERPECPVLLICTGFLLAMGCALGCSLLPRPWLRLVACPVCSALLVFVGGAWPAMLFVALAGMFEIVAGRRWALGWGCFLSGSIAMCGVVWASHADGVFVSPVGGLCLVAALALYLYIVILCVVLAALRAASGGSPTEGGPPWRARAFSLLGWYRKPAVKRTIAAGLFILCAAWIWCGMDRQRQALAQIDCYGARDEDQKVLAIAAKLRQMQSLTQPRVCLALYHSGRLGDDLFSYGTPSLNHLLSGFRMSRNSWRAGSETFLELGQVDEAEHFAHEALESEGENPETLRLLADINVLKGRPAAARIFLNVLALVPFERNWAERRLRELEQDPALSADLKLDQIRSRLVKWDVIHRSVPTEGLLSRSLQFNPQNRMALDYLMAFYMLSRQDDKLVAELQQLSDPDYAYFPRLWEEAVLSFQALKGAPVDLRGRQIHPETVQRYQQFCQAAARLRAGADHGNLARDFGDTYWYYREFGPTNE